MFRHAGVAARWGWPRTGGGGARRCGPTAGPAIPTSAAGRVRLPPLLIVWLALPGCGESVGERRVYVERLGDDTTAVEALARGERAYRGERVTRQPVTRVARYRAALDREGRVERLEVEWTTPPENAEGPPAQRLAVEIEDGTATIVRAEDGRTDTVRAEVPPGTIPVMGIPLSVATWEQAVRQMAAEGTDRYEVSLLAPNGRVAGNLLERRSADTVALDFFGSPMLAGIGPEGLIETISGRATTLKIEVRRAEDPGAVDPEALASEFAARDVHGEGFGVASPTDTVTTSAAGATFEVVYARPSMRGRDIWGGLVPYGEVWRTGANAATHFTVDRDVLVGDAEVSAGTYTLWTTFTPDSATLIVNQQTGIWGTAHDAANDLVRVPLQASSLGEPAERFTIRLEPTGQGVVLSLAWDTTRFSVPIRVR